MFDEITGILLPYIFEIFNSAFRSTWQKKGGKGGCCKPCPICTCICMKELRGLQTVTRHDKGGGSGGRSDLIENHCIIFIMKFPILPDF